MLLFWKSPSMRTQTNFRLSLISARDKRQGEIRLVLTGYKVLKFLVESLLDVTGEGENWTSAIRKSSSLRWKPEHVREQRRGWRSKATNLGVLKDTSMAKIVTYRHWTSYKWDLLHMGVPMEAAPKKLLAIPQAPIRLEGQPCSALLTGGGRSSARLPLLSVALQGLCFRRSLF